MTYTINIFKVDYNQISKAIYSFTARDRCGKSPNFIIMSLDTLNRIQDESLHLMSLSHTPDYSHEIMGVKIAINNTLDFGEIIVV